MLIMNVTSYCLKPNELVLSMVIINYVSKTSRLEPNMLQNLPITVLVQEFPKQVLKVIHNLCSLILMYTLL